MEWYLITDFTNDTVIMQS